MDGVQAFRRLRDADREIFLEILPLLCHHFLKLISIEKGLLLGKSLSLFFS